MSLFMENFTLTIAYISVWESFNHKKFLRDTDKDWDLIWFKNMKDNTIYLGNLNPWNPEMN